MKTPTPSALLDPAQGFLEPGAGAARAAGDGEDEPDAGPSGRVKGFLVGHAWKEVYGFERDMGDMGWLDGYVPLRRS